MSDGAPLNLAMPSSSSSEGKSEGMSKQASIEPQPQPVPVRRSKEGALHVLGDEHDTVLYHGDDVAVKLPEPDDEDDTFFKPTIEDAKSLYKDLQRRRDELENAPFKGQKLRELEKETAILKSLHDHPNTVIRVRFPDRFVLQGIFRTSDTISSVKSWLREYLNDPNLKFYIFTAPPKKVLQDEAKLVEERLVAMAVIYFGAEDMPDCNSILKADLYARISDPVRTFELAKNKLKVRKSDGENDDEEVKPSTETQLKEHTATEPQQTVSRPVDKGKVPKWFKMK